jgi:hypothetical protein
MKANLCTGWIVVFFLTLLPATAFTGSTNISWYPNPEPDLSEYRIYYGTSSRDYGPPIPVEKVTQHTVTGLEVGKTYYFTVTAMDSSGNESGYSAEVSRVIDSMPHQGQTTLIVDGPGNTDRSTPDSTPPSKQTPQHKVADNVLPATPVPGARKPAQLYHGVQREAVSEEQAGYYSYFLPGFQSDPDHWTVMGIRNSSYTKKTSISVNVFDEMGELIASESRQLAPRWQESFKIGDTLPRKGWIQVSADQPLTGFCFVATLKNDYMPDIPLISKRLRSLRISDVRQGPEFDTRILICNPNPSDTMLTISFSDTEGFQAATRTYQIPAFGSSDYQVADWVSDTARSNTGIVDISADNGVVAFALSNNRKSGGKFFSGIQAVAPDKQVSYAGAGVGSYNN